MELLKEKEYELLSECQYFDKNGTLQSTKKVKMTALKFCDSSLVEGTRISALQAVVNKEYIRPFEEGKLKIDTLDVRSALILWEEYYANFLDLSPFLPKE